MQTLGVTLRSEIHEFIDARSSCGVPVAFCANNGSLAYRALPVVFAADLLDVYEYIARERERENRERERERNK